MAIVLEFIERINAADYRDVFGRPVGVRDAPIAIYAWRNVGLNSGDIEQLVALNFLSFSVCAALEFKGQEAHAD